MISKINKSNYNVHIVNLLQLTVPTEHIIARATLKMWKFTCPLSSNKLIPSHGRIEKNEITVLILLC